MTDVACFCGCCYSFDGGAGACPKCGEYAVVRPEPAVAGTGRRAPEPGPAVNGNGNAHTREPAARERVAVRD